MLNNRLISVTFSSILYSVSKPCDNLPFIGTNTTAQQPWFNLLPRQPCATATTKLSDLKAHLEAAERERSMSQIQVC